MNRIIVFGASGQLGLTLQCTFKSKTDFPVTFFSTEAANITDLIKLKSVFEEHSPAYCVNCAAYTAVDKAEDEPELARMVNRDGVENLSKLCKKFNSVLIHVSTDFVFSGRGNEPLAEHDKTNPISVYGNTKLEGEHVIQSLLERYFILRTSWLYSEYGNNFTRTMLRLAKEKKELSVIWDQIGTPTYAVDLANCIFEIIKTSNSNYGVYHFSNEGATSWYDFAKSIFDLKSISVRIKPIRTFEYPTKAIRPIYSVLDKAKVKQNLGIEIPHWRESLKKCLERL